MVALIDGFRKRGRFFFDVEHDRTEPKKDENVTLVSPRSPA
jgi:hypothetical protein